MQLSNVMKSAVLHGVDDLRIEELPIPAIVNETDVLVRIRAVGICGSDIHYFREGRIGRYILRKPMILGHECAGEVVEVGSAVKHLKPGDKVAIEPGIGCGRCEYCHRGAYNLCPQERFLGALAEYIVHPEEFLFKLPDELPFEAGALCEPLSVALYAIKRAQLEPATTIAVLGCGPIGLALIQAALATGAAFVYATDIYPLRLQTARKLGASMVLNANETDVVNAINEHTDGRGVDVVFEAAGSLTTQRQAFHIVKRGGVIVLVGMPSQIANEVPLLDLIMRECDVRGVFRYANVYGQAVALTSTGRVNLLPMVTHRFSLERAREALETADAQKERAIKVMIMM